MGQAGVTAVFDILPDCIAPMILALLAGSTLFGIAVGKWINHCRENDYWSPANPGERQTRTVSTLGRGTPAGEAGELPPSDRLAGLSSSSFHPSALAEKDR